MYIIKFDREWSKSGVLRWVVINTETGKEAYVSPSKEACKQYIQRVAEAVG